MARGPVSWRPYWIFFSGTISNIIQYIKIYHCTNFHACDRKPTILSPFSPTNTLHQQYMMISWYNPLLYLTTLPFIRYKHSRKPPSWSVSRLNSRYQLLPPAGLCKQSRNGVTGTPGILQNWRRAKNIWVVDERLDMLIFKGRLIHVIDVKKSLFTGSCSVAFLCSNACCEGGRSFHCPLILYSLNYIFISFLTPLISSHYLQFISLFYFFLAQLPSLLTSNTILSPCSSYSFSILPISVPSC